MDAFSGEAPMTVLDWAVFSSQPARLHCSFSFQDGRYVSDPALVFDLTQRGTCSDVTFDDASGDVVVRVTSREELCHVLCRLQRQLLLTRVTVFHTEIASRRQGEAVTIVEDELAVLVNFSHPSLRLSLTKAAQRAAACLARHRNFCLEIDLTDVLVDWYMTHRDAITSCDDIHNLRTRRARVCVTNHRAYSHQLDCSPHWVAFLCLCWILVVPCYLVFRKLTCSDIRIKVLCDVTCAGSSATSEQKRMVAPTKQATSYNSL